VLAAQAHPAAEEIRRVERLVQAEVGRITRLIDDLLLLARQRADGVPAHRGSAGWSGS